MLNILLNWQRAVTEPEDGRWIRIGGGRVTAREYLMDCRHLLRLLCFDPRGEEFSRAVAQHSGWARPALTEESGRLRFERSDVRARHGNLLLLTWLLSDWPVSFLRLCMETGVSLTALVQPNEKMPLPPWYGQQCLAVQAIRPTRRGLKPKMTGDPTPSVMP